MAQEKQIWDALVSGDARQLSDVLRTVPRIAYAVQRMNMISQWEYIAGPRLTWTRSLQGAWKFDSREAAEEILPAARTTGTMSAVARVVKVTIREIDGKQEYEAS